MKQQGYIAVKNFFDTHPKLKKFLVLIQKGAEILIYLTYPVFIAVLFLANNWFWAKSVVVCGVGFILVSLFRHFYNAPRPYQVYDIQPVINKNTKGKSMPSRHCFSASVIALSVSVINLPLGIIIGVLALIIAILRVAFGVHFIKDVLAGLIVGILIGFIQYFI